MRKGIELLRRNLADPELAADCIAVLSALHPCGEEEWRGCVGQIPQEDGVYLFLLSSGAGWRKQVGYKKEGKWDAGITPHLFDINSFVRL